MENLKKPEWLNKKVDYESLMIMSEMLRSLNLHTVCEGAKCPNMGECFRNRTATFMILGDICTRNCKFCAIPTGKTTPVDHDEPKHLAEAALKLKLSHVVITSVTRDDLPYGGAAQFARCIQEVRTVLPKASIEVLIPDFRGEKSAIDIVIEARPEIINHNVETVPSLYKSVRPMAKYSRSLELLGYVKDKNPEIYTKSGIMVGLGEKFDEILNVLDDLRNYNCDMLTIGQYLPPSYNHALLKEYVKPEIFEELKQIALKKGFKFVASGPYVRSSYHAMEVMNSLKISENEVHRI